MKILKFYSNTCPPCRILEKNLQEVGIDHESVDIGTDEGLSTAMQYGVRSTPTLLVVDDSGSVVKSHIGLLTVDKLKEWMQQ